VLVALVALTTERPESGSSSNTTRLDRLLHYSTTVNIRGESYRLKDRRKAGLLGTPERSKNA